jgi:hypothetical protein
MVSKQFVAHKLFENDIEYANLGQKVIYGSVAVAPLVSQYLLVSFASKNSPALFGDNSFHKEYSRMADCPFYFAFFEP